MEFAFRTIKSPSEGIYKEKGSKFLAFAYPVGSEEEIKSKVETLKKEYFDARHHCYAWMLGPDKKRFRAFDDGEPNHSAGDPILGQIRSKNLTNVLVIVVRYFGGVKLGVGGLIAAYKMAAEEALRNAEIIEKEVMGSVTLDYDYSSTPEIMRMVKEFELSIKEQRFDNRCSIDVEFKVRHEARIRERINLLKAIGHVI